ncbi:MAG TPA: SCO family protein [Sphingomicrobium sp.]|nr:SCO family protein [Sphingomicrobium sp.]
MTLRQIRIILWVAAGLAALAGLAIALRPMPADGPIASSGSLAEIGGPFTLTATDGKAFSSEQLAGKPYALFFGFTHCPDVCPTTLARLARLRNALGKGNDSFAIVLVSVDPDRDTPAAMARYAGLFGTPVIALTGTTAAIERVKKLYGVYSAKVPQAGADYTVDHNATVFLIDRAGRFAATISPSEGDNAARAKLDRLVKDGSAT